MTRDGVGEVLRRLQSWIGSRWRRGATLVKERTEALKVQQSAQSDEWELHGKAEGQADTRKGHTPPHLVRLCRRRTEFISIINEATKNPLPSPWPEDLINRVVEYIFQGKEEDLSVYATKTTDPLDQGHALSVIAESITQKEFRATARQRKRGCTRGTLIIPTASLPKRVSFQLTPENNLNFFPADYHHYDLSTPNIRELAVAILDSIHARTSHWTLLDNDDGSYRLQAAIAYSYCLSVFGKLDQDIPPPEWREGNELSSREQIEILKYLVDTSAIDSPVKASWPRKVLH